MNGKDFDFESSFKELENIVKKLENGSEKLDTNLALYEKGMDLYKNCKKNLEKAKLKIEILNNDTEKE